MLTVVKVTPVLRLSHPASQTDTLTRFCRSMQLVTQRDLDGTATTVLRAILEEAPDQPVGSSTLAARTRINRVTIIHHLNRLEQAGLVEHTEHKYKLSIAGFGDMVRRIRADTEKMLAEAEQLAEQIDKEYELAASRGQTTVHISASTRRSIQSSVPALSSKKNTIRLPNIRKSTVLKHSR
jgi:predicted transcriptional regulator